MQRLSLLEMRERCKIQEVNETQGSETQTWGTQKVMKLSRPSLELY